jgi:hypothetical protein
MSAHGLPCADDRAAGDDAAVLLERDHLRRDQQHLEAGDGESAEQHEETLGAR